MKTFKRIVIIILSIILVLQTYNTICLFPHRLEYKSYRFYGVYVKKPELRYTKSEIREKIEDLLGDKYFYIKTKKSTKVFIPLRLVYINEDVSELEYTESLTHELTHLKYQTRNERFVTLQAIKLLYETNDEYFKYVAICYANDVWNGQFSGTQYDCGAYLLEYFGITS